MELGDELDKPWSIKTKHVMVETTSCTLNAQTGLPTERWKTPTISWLINPAYFQPCCLPMMKTPGGLGGGVYDSKEEYFDIVMKLWVAMTFSEGNNALSPRCNERNGEKACGQVLWPLAASSIGTIGGLASLSSRLTCRTRNCNRPVTMVCRHKYHNRGLCEDCCVNVQTCLRGPPGRHGSTHIYDATIRDLCFDGRVFFHHLSSRRPPETSVHWRTTKRLSCPNLVGIVKLSSREATCRLSDRIIWGQIAVHGQSRDEHSYRERGEVAVSLIKVSAEHDLLSVNHPSESWGEFGLLKGDHVAIIDLQTFSPEFIPVLQALETQRASRMPFKNGSLLNISKTFHHDSGSLIIETLSESAFSGRPHDDGEIEDCSIDEQIDQLLNESDLDPIVQVCRSDSSRATLKQRLVELVVKATLDHGQLESFLNSLRHQVHCTQGPPGTGYVLCIVLDFQKYDVSLPFSKLIRMISIYVGNLILVWSSFAPF